MDNVTHINIGSGLKSLDLGCDLEWVMGTSASGPSFWGLLGPLVTNADFVKEAAGGYNIIVNDRQRWVFAIKDNSVVACGCFSSPEKPGKPSWFEHVWLSPAVRGLPAKNIVKAIFGWVLVEANDVGVSTVRACTKNMQIIMRRYGFKTYQQRGSWHYMEREV